MTEDFGYNRTTLLEMFHSREVTVKFKKTDGSIRLLRGTLNEDLFPAQQSLAKGVGFRQAHKPVSDLVTVWDLDAAGWRSFHPASVLEVF